MSITLVLPPQTQLNTPYPSISYLAGWLRNKGIDCEQRDLGIEWMLRIFSRAGLEPIFEALQDEDSLPDPAWRALSLAPWHLRVVEPVVRFLQGHDRGLGPRILETPFLPQGPRLERANLDAFGPMGTQDAARHLATLYLEDLADLITACVDPGFSLIRYHHNLAVGATSFDPLWERLGHTTVLDAHLDALTDTLTTPVVGLSVPFPGNLYAALRIGRRLRARGVVVVLGGGYVNTELREVNEPRVWECVDQITYDDGESPLLAILSHLDGGPDQRHRTLDAQGRHEHNTPRPPMTCAADYRGLELGHYLQLLDTLNPAHRLWSDGRWNKITVAHGCYWRKCTFCDVNLDYIQHFETASTTELVDQMERTIAHTGQRGFHFVDEAAPPRALKALALALLRRELGVSIWGNIRFESTYTPDLCRLLAASGLVAVTGGLEVANERLLKAIDKGVTVEQVAQCAAAFRHAGVMVHAYLMYGFPTQTDQETLDSMEWVRQLFAEGVLDSAFWHRFVLTRHAPIYSDPHRFGIRLVDQPPDTFSRNDIQHLDPTGGDHDRFDAVLPAALNAWMQGRELHRPVHSWLKDNTLQATQAPHRIADALTNTPASSGPDLIWLGGSPLETDAGLVLPTLNSHLTITGSPDVLDWMCEVVSLASTQADEPLRFSDAKEAFPGDWSQFSPQWQRIRRAALLRV